jgi:hypothetical protein
MRGWLVRHSFGISVALLSAIIVSAAAFLLVVALPDILGLSGPSASTNPQPSPSGSPALSVMSWVAMPADADCSACHLTAGGGIGLKPVPPMAHPLTGWTNCTACHAPDSLVAVAPGHSGLHASDCLLCHQPQTLPPPLSRPHRDSQNQDCLDCHGKTAPLPADMAHRSETVCWLCHRLPDVQPPVPAHPVTAGQANCLSCHVAGGAAGALPDDHAGRTAAECLLCHAPSMPSAEPPTPAPTVTATPPPAGDYKLQFVLLPPLAIGTLP